MSAQRTRPAAFTLVELLVVISIISTLLAMLLPALGSARESAKRAVCLSQLRQFETAVTNYAIDQKNHYWPTYHTAVGYYFPLAVADTNAFRGWPTFSKAYGLFDKILQCPSKPIWSAFNFNADWGPVHYSSYSYIANPDAGLGPAPNIWLSTAFYNAIPKRIEQGTAATVISGDSIYMGTTGILSESIIPHMNNGVLDGANQVFGDGHGKWKPRSDFPAVLSNTGAGRNACVIFQPPGNNTAMFW